MENNATQNTDYRRPGLFTNMDLFNNPKYHKLSLQAITLYSFYHQRQQVSIFYRDILEDDTFVDENGRPFIYFANDLAAKILKSTKRSVTTYKKELIDCGLIESVKLRSGSCKIYVNEVEETSPKQEELVVPWANFSYRKNSKKSEVMTSSENEEVVEEVNETFEENPEVVEGITAAFNSSTNGSTEIKNTPGESNEFAQGKIFPTNHNKYNYIKTNNISSDTGNTDFNSDVTKKSVKSVGQNELEKMSIEAIENKLKPVFSASVVGKIKTLAQNSYAKIKFYSDTIFKAKSQVVNNLLEETKFLYSDEITEATRFEKNTWLISGLESTLLKIAEVMFKSDEQIHSVERFVYVYLRNSIANSIKKYLFENFEFSKSDYLAINQRLSY